MKINRDLTAAFVPPLLLALLAEERAYGYEIIKRVREASDGALQWSEGMVYPLLHRLEKRGLIASEWGDSEIGRRRRYYSITPRGRVELERRIREWAVVQRALARHGFVTGGERSS